MSLLAAATDRASSEGASAKDENQRQAAAFQLYLHLVLVLEARRQDLF
jgi:hypothetical protein